MGTSPEGAALQERIQSALSGTAKLIMALQMSAAARELALCRLRAEHRELNEAEIRRLFIKQLHGVLI